MVDENAQPKATGPHVRLAAIDWINAALDVMVEQSVEQVRIEPLAARLKITKGSFYWHFKDREALLAAVIDHWVDRATLAIIRRVEQQGQTSESRILQLFMVPFASERSPRGADIELAIRAWSRRSAMARAAIDRVDRLRLAYFQQLFEAAGFPAVDAGVRAYAAYSFMHSAAYIKSEDKGIPAEASQLVHHLLLQPAETP